MLGMQEIVFKASAFFKEMIEFQNSVPDWVSAGRYCYRNYETLSLAPARLFNSELAPIEKHTYEKGKTPCDKYH